MKRRKQKERREEGEVMKSRGGKVGKEGEEIWKEKDEGHEATKNQED